MFIQDSRKTKKGSGFAARCVVWFLFCPEVSLLFLTGLRIDVGVKCFGCVASGGGPSDTMLCGEERLVYVIPSPDYAYSYLPLLCPGSCKRAPDPGLW